MAMSENNNESGGGGFGWGLFVGGLLLGGLGDSLLMLSEGVTNAGLAAFLAGAVVGVGIIVVTGDRKRGVPFGPFLALGGLVGVLVGPELIDFYSDRFLS